MKKIILLCLIFISACEQSTENKSIINKKSNEKNIIEPTISGRWYTQTQISVGKKVYQKSCLECHNKDAVGTAQWKKSSANGVFPPPPLNGSAHAWHHGIGTLTRVIKNGGVPLGGVMPPFKAKLTDEEVASVIAYFQHFWNDEVYKSWLENGGLE